MRYSIDEITSLIGARRYGHSVATIEWLLTDSRSLVFPESSLFFAIRTSRADGARYIPDLYQRGMRNFVVERLPLDMEAFPDANFLLTANALLALQRLAERHREAHPCPVCAITGSCGKTIVKEWMFQLLAPTLAVTRSPGSYNSQIGVPLSVCLLDHGTQVGLFEAGISQPGEMDALRAIIQPSIGVITNIGAAHGENFANDEAKCAEKLRLFTEARVVVACEDHETVACCLHRELPLIPTFLWSRRNPAAQLYVARELRTETSTTLSIVCGGETSTITIPFVSDASVENALTALTAALCLLSTMRPAENIHALLGILLPRLQTLLPIAGRLEVKEGINGNTVIVDTGMSDIRTLDMALDFLHRRAQQTSGTQECVAILSDIWMGGMPDAAHLRVTYAEAARLLGAHGVDRLIAVGPHFAAHADLFSMPVETFPTTDDLLASGLTATLRSCLVLVKGASMYGFDRVTAVLSQRVHETTLEVNLSALAANLTHYRSLLRPGVRTVCMVKASAYGAGAVEVARTLSENRADYLAVAVSDEGVELRRRGITADIIVMNPEMSTFGDLFRYHLQPEVYSFRLLDALSSAASRAGIVGFPVHIKLDTGMHRLGFHPEDDIDTLIARLRNSPALIPRSVFSHFAGSDDEALDEFTHEQFARFHSAAERLQQAFPHRILRHICNTAAIARFPQYQCDMVRLGLGLYGIDPVAGSMMDCVSSLRSVILQVREVSACDTVGYGRKGELHRPSRIAVVPMGYADGLNRRLGCGRGACVVNGYRAPYVGNICMDVCMIDVTDIPCREGDKVEIFGPEMPVTQLAQWLDTIPYEVLTAVSPRVARVYYRD